VKGEKMKKIVAIMAVSLMLFTSCGQIKELVGINKGSEGSGTIGSTLPTPPTPAAEKTFWGNWGKTIGVSVGGAVITTAAAATFTMWYKGWACFKDKTIHPAIHADHQEENPKNDNHEASQEDPFFETNDEGKITVEEEDQT
jgi:hypothetical protein